MPNPSWRKRTSTPNLPSLPCNVWTSTLAIPQPFATTSTVAVGTRSAPYSRLPVTCSLAPTLTCCSALPPPPVRRRQPSFPSSRSCKSSLRPPSVAFTSRRSRPSSTTNSCASTTSAPNATSRSGIGTATSPTERRSDSCAALRASFRLRPNRSRPCFSTATHTWPPSLAICASSSSMRSTPSCVAIVVGRHSVSSSDSRVRLGSTRGASDCRPRWAIPIQSGSSLPQVRNGAPSFPAYRARRSNGASPCSTSSITVRRRPIRISRRPILRRSLL